MFEVIIVPLDGSELAEAMLPRVQEIASRFGSRIVLVQAIDSMSQRLAYQAPMIADVPVAAGETVELLEEGFEAEKSEAMRYLEGVRDRLAAASVTAEPLLVEGSAGDVILDVASERGADLIVMSTHGRGGLGRLVFGSVTDHVLRHSKTPVLVARSDG